MCGLRRRIGRAVVLGLVLATSAALRPYDANGSTFALVSYSDGVLAGTNAQGRTFSADIDQTTWLRPAALDLIPNDTVLPCQELAEDYNAALGIGLGDGGASVSAAITSLADAGYNARVTGAVQSTNPLLPPSPIRSFQRFPEPDDRTCGDARVPRRCGIRFAARESVRSESGRHLRTAGTVGRGALGSATRSGLSWCTRTRQDARQEGRLPGGRLVQRPSRPKVRRRRRS